MAIFGRKKDEDDEDEDDAFEEEGRHNRKFSRKFKDLKGENKKKRKEPPKPWGKRERLLILVTILVTMILSGILAFTSSGNRLAGIKFNFTKPDFSFDIFKEKTIIIEK